MPTFPQISLRRIRRTAALCVLLLAISGLAQAMHQHPQDPVRGDTDKVRCSLCVLGQTPLQASARVDVVPPQPVEYSAAATLVTPSLKVERLASRIRPPPAL